MPIIPGPKTLAWTSDIETIPIAGHREDESPDNAKIGDKDKLQQARQQGKEGARLAELFQMLDKGHQAKFEIKLTQFFKLYDFDGSATLTLAELIGNYIMWHNLVHNNKLV